MIVDGLFWLDLILNFIHSYKDAETFKPVLGLKAIAWNYIRYGWFFVDFVSVFPFKTLVGNEQVEFTKLMRLLRLPRLLKFIDLQRFKSTIQKIMSGGGASEENITM